MPGNVHNLLGITDEEMVRRLRQEVSDISQGLSSERPINDGIWVAYSSYAFKFLQSHFPGLPAAECQGIAYDSVDKFVHAILDQKYVPQANAKSTTYFTWICRNKCIDFLRKQNRYVAYDSDKHQNLQVSVENDVFLKRAIKEQAEDVLDDVLRTEFEKEDCRKVIYFKYFDKLSHEEIRRKMQYGSIGVSRNKLRKCLEYFRKTIKSSKRDILRRLRKLYNYE
ncbi:MAG: hypothetical protein AAFV95_24085 [Bacteroidota bacterium]